jgi:hypothetical protein
MKLILIIILFSPLTFSQSYIDETPDTFEENWNQTSFEEPHLNWEQNDENDPFLELGGSENINYAEDHYYEEKTELINEINDPL